MEGSKEENKVIQELARTRDAFIEAFEQIRLALINAIASDGASLRVADEVEGILGAEQTAEEATDNAIDSTLSSGEDPCGGCCDDDAELFSRETLPPQQFDEEGLREHLNASNISDLATLEVLELTLPNRSNVPFRLRYATIVPHGDLIPRVHRSDDKSMCETFDVGADNLPIHFNSRQLANGFGRSMKVWEALRKWPSTLESAVGRITIANELSPALLAALHYTMDRTFRMDHVFRSLIYRYSSAAWGLDPFVWEDEYSQKGEKFSRCSHLHTSYLKVIWQDQSTLQLARQCPNKPMWFTHGSGIVWQTDPRSKALASGYERGGRRRSRYVWSVAIIGSRNLPEEEPCVH